MFRRTFHSTPSCVFFPPSSSLVPISPGRTARHHVPHQNQAETQGSESAEDKKEKPSANLPGEVGTVEPTLWEQLRSRQPSLCFFNRAKRDLEVFLFTLTRQTSPPKLQLMEKVFHILTRDKTQKPCGPRSRAKCTQASSDHKVNTTKKLNLLFLPDCFARR